MGVCDSFISINNEPTCVLVCVGVHLHVSLELLHTME